MKNTLYLYRAFNGMSLLAMAVLFVAAPSTFAQFGGLKNKLGLGGKKKDATLSVVDKDAFGGTLEGVLGNVSKARIAFIDAQLSLHEALGLKTKSTTKLSEAKRAIEGASSDPGKKVKTLKDSTKVSKQANKELEKAMENSGELSAESKKIFAKGSAQFIDGIFLEKKQIETIQKLVEQGKQLTQSANPLEKLKVAKLIRPVAALASLVPGDVKEGASTLKSITKFTKRQQIKVPADQEKTNDLLGDL
jgi:cyclophilin family peptidyl-prolyl cis-trans isomerase